MQKKITLFLILVIASSNLFAQQIRGTVIDASGKPIKYATIYVDELQTGTSANQNGEYFIRVSKGEFTISFRALGYSPTVKKVHVNSDKNIQLNITLQIQSYILAGVTVRADNEDPAYAIMRKAIARVPGFLNQAKSFTSEVYIKGSVKVDKIPKIIQKRIQVNGEKPQSGTTYVNESLNIIRFTAPETYKQEVISVNNTFPINEKDVPVFSLISTSIYESTEDLYISPFAPNAFSHYKFAYEGLLQDGNQFINKIKVTPKRKSKLLMEGYLYIIEDIWCLYSYDMKLHPLYVHLEMKQHYAPVKGNNYFPVNLFVNARLDALGVKANATYTTTIKYDSVVLNPAFAQTNSRNEFFNKPVKIVEEEKDEKVINVEKKIEELIKSDELTNREMSQLQKLMSKKAALQEESQGINPLEIKSNYHVNIREDAATRDSVYWDSIRPVPASEDEKISYKKRAKEVAKKDSASLFLKIIKTALFGNYKWERSRKHYIYYPGIIKLKSIAFNPVEGFKVKQHFIYRWAIDSTNLFRIYGTGGYAFHSKEPFGTVLFRLQYARLKRAQIDIKAGYLTSDFGGGNGTPEDISAIYNLLFKKSLKKYYHNTYINAGHYIDIVNGLHLRVNVGYSKVRAVRNNTQFSLFYPQKDYVVNEPENRTINNSHLRNQERLGYSVSLSFAPQSRYLVRKGIKYSKGSKWPRFTVAYKQNIAVNTNFSEYQHISASIGHKIDFYTISELRYIVSAGKFFNVGKMHFSSFSHFSVFQEEISTRKFDNTFILLDNYEYSTNKTYARAHLKYTNDFLLLKHLPFISNQMWRENLFVNVLFSNGHKPYYELGYSMSKILFNGRVGVFAGFKGDRFHGVGVRASFKF